MRRYDVQSTGFARVARPLRFPKGTGAGQRRSDRREMRVTAMLREVGTEDLPLPIDLTEVSTTGAFLASDLLLPVGAAVEMKFTLPDDKGDIDASGRVIRVQHRGLRPGMGVVFERMAPGDRRLLREFTAPI